MPGRVTNHGREGSLRAYCDGGHGCKASQASRASTESAGSVKRHVRIHSREGGPLMLSHAMQYAGCGAKEAE